MSLFLLGRGMSVKIGDRFGLWEVIADKRDSKYLCLCTGCNNKQTSIAYYRLVKTKGCQNCVNKTKNPISPGDMFGYWKVLRKDESKIYHTIVLCTGCNLIEKSMRNSDLRKKSSCGCKTKEVVTNTMKERYGAYFNNRGKAKKTSLEKYGYDNPAKSQQIKNKVKKTCLEKFGGYYTETDQFIEKRTQTYLERYGVDSYSKLPEQKNKLKEWCEQNPEKLFISKAELEILEWIQTFYPTAKKYRIAGNELDIYIPEMKIGIEHNGLYWHRASKVGSAYHLNKTRFFKEKGIRVIHIFEHEWFNNKDQVKSFVQSAINQNSNKIGSRKCKFIWSDSKKDKKEVKDFLNKYHIQGQVGCKYVVKATYDGELIGCATFGKHHRNSTDWVLSRFCTKQSYTIQGGLAKMSKMASKELDADIISWAHYRISDGNGYRKAGWVSEELSKPDYFYHKGLKIISKQSRQKSIVDTPDNMTESEHAKIDGLEKVYDCGKIRFRYKKK